MQVHQALSSWSHLKRSPSCCICTTQIETVQVSISGNADTHLNILIKAESDSPHVLKKNTVCPLLHGVITRKRTSTLKSTRNQSYSKCTSGSMPPENASGVIDTDWYTSRSVITECNLTEFFIRFGNVPSRSE